MSGEALRFDGQVAIVTGAGGQKPSLGETYARYLAARGARVVVNDLGVGPDGTNALPANAQAIVDEINAAGGEAVGDTHSVAGPDSARAVVQTALDAWGRVDILVNNAGVVFFTEFDEISDGDIRRIVDTHLYGNIWMCRAVWPHMIAAGEGRIVNTVSGSVIGAKYSTVYGASKAAIFGFTRNLAIEAEPLGIKVNSILPSAATVAWLTFSDDETRPDENVLQEHSPNLVAPALAFLMHDSVPCNGRCLGMNGTNVYEVGLWRSKGVTGTDWTPEKIRENLAQISSREDLGILGDPFDGQAGYTLQPRDYPE